MANPVTQLAHTVQENAHRLELQIATARLLTNLFQMSNGTGGIAGRYHFLERVIEQRPALLRAILDNNNENMQREWSQILLTNQSDVCFLHGLAILYRESALASLARGKQEGDLWFRSTTLWALLLGAREFWEYFSEARFSPEKSANTPRRSLDETEQNDLLKKTLQTILSLHSSNGSKDFAGHRYAQAYNHLRCLDLCRSGEKALVEMLWKYGVRWSLTLNKQRLEQVINQAEQLLDSWCLTLVQEAKKITNDAEAIKQLPKGIRQNYEGGIAHLDPFIKLKIPVVRVLTASLDWYNDWCYDLYVTKDIKRIKELMQSANAVADQLIPQSTKGRPYRGENQVLSKHFLLRGFTIDDSQEAIKEYEEAVEWNSANANAEQLLGDAYNDVLMRQLKVAIECVERKQFNTAYEILDAVEEKAKDKSQLQEARAAVYFRHADALADDGKFREALSRANEALVLEPQHPVIKQFVDMMKKLAPEEDNYKYMQSAKDAYDKDRYDYAIRNASQVSRNSQFYDQARRLQSGSYFHRGVQAAKQAIDAPGQGAGEKLTRAVTDLENALALNDDKGERKIIESQLEVLRQATVGVELRQAMEAMDFSRAEQLLRKAVGNEASRRGKKELENQLSLVLNAHAVTIINQLQSGYGFGGMRSELYQARKLLEEAVSLDSSNRTARANLDTLKKLL